LGACALLFSLFLPRGIWGTLTDRLGIDLMPVGYRLKARRTAHGEDTHRS
jgi:branched-chain amino acid transport system permease protein